MWTLHLLPSHSTFHSSLFTFNFPKGLLFTSRRDRFSLPAGNAVRRPMQHGAIADAARCDGWCSTLRGHMHRAAVSRRAFPVFYKAASVGTHSIPPHPFHPVAGPVKAAPQARSCRHTFPSGTQPQPSLSPLEKGAETLLPYKKAGSADIAGDIRTAWCYSVKGSSAMRTWYRCACDAWQPHRCAGIS